MVLAVYANSVNRESSAELFNHVVLLESNHLSNVCSRDSFNLTFDFRVTRRSRNGLRPWSAQARVVWLISATANDRRYSKSKQQARYAHET